MNIIKQILENKWKKDIETYVRRHGELALLILSLLLAVRYLRAGTGACSCGADSLVGRPVPGLLYAGGGGKRSADPVSISHIFEPERAGGLYRRNR